MRELPSVTRITYLSKIIGIPSIAAVLQPELFWGLYSVLLRHLQVQRADDQEVPAEVTGGNQCVSRAEFDAVTADQPENIPQQ